MTQAGHLRGVVLEGHRVHLLELLTDEVLDLRVELRTHDELAALAERPYLALFHDDMTTLEHVTRIGEQHAISVRLFRINRHVAVGTDPEMTFLCQAKSPGRAC